MTGKVTLVPNGDRERRFFTLITTTIAVVVLFGFARTFFLRSLFPEAQSFAAPEPIFFIHGLFFTAWIGFLVLQAFLIRVRRADLHRSLGWIGVGLAFFVVLLGTYGSLIAAQRPGGFIGVPLPPLQFLIFPILDMVLFATFFALAIIWRDRPQSHKRLMVLAAVNLVEAAIIRIPIAFIGAGAPFTSRGLSYLFIVALIVWDLRISGRIHRVTFWGGLVIVASFPARMLVSQMPTWAEVASRLIQLVE
jgi:hypothetical protein